MKQRIEKWIERLSEDYIRVVMRVGNRSNEQEEGEWHFPLEDMNDFLDDCMELSDGEKFRLIAYQEKSKKPKSKTFTPPVAAQNTTASDTGMLVNGLIEMTGEVRRCLAVMADMQEQREDTMQYILESLVMAREEQAEAQLAIGLMDAENERLKEETGNTAKDRAVEMLGRLVGGVKLTPATAKKALLENPDLVKELAQDSEVQNVIMGALGFGDD